MAVSFWKWRFAREGKDYPSYLRIKVSKRLCNRKDESTVLSPDEVGQMVEMATKRPRQGVHRHSVQKRARVGELLGLRIGDVERTDYSGFRLRLPMGKTGKRTVPLFEAAIPPLSQWLHDHPRASDPGAPLWCGLQSTERLGEPMNYRASTRSST